jgi:hypothetical protein
MVSLDRAMTDMPFQMLTIVFNDDHKMSDNFARQLGATFPVLSNPSPALNEAYMITGVPETFIIDADAILRHKFIGPHNWNAWEKRSLILGLVVKKRSAGTIARLRNLEILTSRQLICFPVCQNFVD